MAPYDNRMAPQFLQRLARRAAELQDLLDGQSADTESSDPHEVSDFKDVAGQEGLTVVDDAQAAHAAAELAQVFAAERRIANGSFGRCVECGEPIDLLRLAAVPTSAYCTACQSLREQPARHHG
jgi:DnaK suppressor protein